MTSYVREHASVQVAGLTILRTGGQAKRKFNVRLCFFFTDNTVMPPLFFFSNCCVRQDQEDPGRRQHPRVLRQREEQADAGEHPVAEQICEAPRCLPVGHVVNSSTVYTVTMNRWMFFIVYVCVYEAKSVI